MVNSLILYQFSIYMARQRGWAFMATVLHLFRFHNTLMIICVAFLDPWQVKEPFSRDVSSG